MPSLQPDAKPGDAKPKPEGTTDAAAKPDAKPVDTELSPDDAADNDTPATTPEKSARSPNGLYEFREERWVELYSKKIEEMIGVLKSKGVPVLWVGLPAIRGQKGTADMLFLDALYRDAAGKAGITYVDIWDGFVDEAGRFLQKGPDFEGQIRQLRSYDGVFFTKPGARKLAHYVEREVTRLLAARSGADRTADGACNARRQCGAGPTRAASAGRTDPAAGGVFRRHRSIARRTRLAPRRSRCAGCANIGEGRTTGGARRPRRRFRLAAPRDRPRTGQGRDTGRVYRTGRSLRDVAWTEATAAATEKTNSPGSAQHPGSIQHSGSAQRAGSIRHAVDPGFLRLWHDAAATRAAAACARTAAPAGQHRTFGGSPAG